MRKSGLDHPRAIDTFSEYSLEWYRILVSVSALPARHMLSKEEVLPAIFGRLKKFQNLANQPKIQFEKNK